MERDYIASIRPYLKELKPLDTIPTAAKPALGSPKVKAVIFDIYGTLLISASGDVDQAEYSSQMIKKALIVANYKIIKDTTDAYDSIYKTYFSCLSKYKEIEIKAGKKHPEVDILKVWKCALTSAESSGIIMSTDTSDVTLFTFVFELQTNRVWPMPGMQKLIKKLEDSDYELGIISNAQFYTPVIMNYFLYDIEKDEETIFPFEKDLTIYSYKELRGKPDVALFEKLIPQLAERGIQAEEAIFVGNDMLKDIYTASEAGLKTVLFAGDKRSYRLRKDDKRCAELKPDYVITELSQLLDILDL